jgi:hypothetical protein
LDAKLKGIGRALKPHYGRNREFYSENFLDCRNQTKNCPF